MKIDRSKVLSVALSLALLGSVAVAQGRPMGGPHEGGFFGEHSLEFFADILNLTDAQQTQIKQIIASAKPTLEPLFRQEMESKKAIMQLAMSGNFDEAKAQSLAQQASQAHVQLEVEHARAISQAYQVLTPEQKTKLAQFLAKREQRMQEHWQEHMQQKPQSE